MCRALEKKVHYEVLNIGKNRAKDNKSHEEAGNGEAISAKPVEIFLRSGFTHEKHDGGTAIQWRNGKKIKSAEEKIEREHGDQCGQQKPGTAVRLRMEQIHGAPSAKYERGEKHQTEIGSRSRKGHPGRPPGMAALPERIVGSAGPTDHSTGKEKAQDRDKNHAKGFAANVGNWIERYLSAESSGGVTTAFGDKSVGCFVAGRRKEKDHIGDERADEKLWG
jgi:hypothetical protein